jgi:hypothetical protein
VGWLTFTPLSTYLTQKWRSAPRTCSALIGAAICFSSLALSRTSHATSPKLGLVAPQAFETIDDRGAPRFNALFTATVKAVAVRVGRAALGNLCEPLRRRGQSG